MCFGYNKNSSIKWENPLPARVKYNIIFSDETEKETKEMLTMDQIYRIRYMKKFEGKSLKKIVEITGNNFSTILKDMLIKKT